MTDKELYLEYLDSRAQVFDPKPLSFPEFIESLKGDRMIRETKMMKNLIAALRELPPVEFVEEYNRMFGTKLTVKDVEFNGDFCVEIE